MIHITHITWVNHPDIIGKAFGQQEAISEVLGKSKVIGGFLIV